MNNIYLIRYAVKGIKNIDEWAELSFYKKTITKDFDIRKYNVKAIYGTNGAGKSAIIASVQILKNLIINKQYLNNPYVQKQLAEMVNKKTGTLSFSIDFLADWGKELSLYHYEIEVGRESDAHFAISSELLQTKKATSYNNNLELMYQVRTGVLVVEPSSNADYLIDLTKNLLRNTSFVSVFIDNLVKTAIDKNPNPAFMDGTYAGHILTLSSMALQLFGQNIYVYLAEDDDHSEFFINDAISETEIVPALVNLAKAGVINSGLWRYDFSGKGIPINKKDLPAFETEISQLCEFLRVFKSRLETIDIEKTVDKSLYYCKLLMNYGAYSVDAEFESTGIKKLIKLFAYFKKMASGNIVFIDELDSNLHDVYLCALLEYLMEHGKGQLCFTTHNIGPMDILKRNKKSIDFLSVDQKIYSWTKNGNYSPSTLYRNGMIEGSPFNVDSVDFLHVFPLIEEE